MSEKTYTNPRVLASRTVTELKKSILVEVVASTDDTVVINELTTITSVAVFNATTGAVVTATPATNVVTITEAALTDEKLIVLAVGS